MNLQHTLAALIVMVLATPAQAQYCREFTQRILVGGRFQQGYGTSCLQPDGAWQITERANLREPSPVNFFYTPPPVNYVQYVQPYPVYQPNYYYKRPGVSIIQGRTYIYDDSCPRHGGRHHGWGHGRGHGHW